MLVNNPIVFYILYIAVILIVLISPIVLLVARLRADDVDQFLFDTTKQILTATTIMSFIILGLVVLSFLLSFTRVNIRLQYFILAFSIIVSIVTIVLIATVMNRISQRNIDNDNEVYNLLIVSIVITILGILGIVGIIIYTYYTDSFMDTYKPLVVGDDLIKPRKVVTDGNVQYEIPVSTGKIIVYKKEDYEKLKNVTLPRFNPQFDANRKLRGGRLVDENVGSIDLLNTRFTYVETSQGNRNTYEFYVFSNEPDLLTTDELRDLERAYERMMQYGESSTDTESSDTLREDNDYDALLDYVRLSNQVKREINSLPNGKVKTSLREDILKCDSKSRKLQNVLDTRLELQNDIKEYEKENTPLAQEAIARNINVLRGDIESEVSPDNVEQLRNEVERCKEYISNLYKNLNR